MRALIVTTNLASGERSSDAAAGHGWRAILGELGELVEGIVLAPDVPGAAPVESLGALEVRRVRPGRPTESLGDAFRGRGIVHVGAVTAGLHRAVRRVLRTSRFDVVHALWAFPSGAVCASAGARPLVVSCPGSDLHTWAGRPVLGAPIRWTLRRADAVTVLSTAGAVQARDAGAGTTTILPMSFDPDVFALDARPPETPVVAYTGRITRAKGVFVLAEALERVAARVAGLRFVACGAGPDAAAFETRVRGALGDRAVFLGPVDPRRVAEVLAGASVAVLPSFGEGMSASVIEALATGRPVVCTDVGEHAALVRRGGGTVVPPGDAVALGDALRTELSVRRDPFALRALVDGYTPARVAGQLVDVYERCVGRRLAPIGGSS